jgi:hypothetical protein
MTRTLLIALLLLAAVPAVACSCSQKKPAEATTSAAPAQGKVEAPVAVDATVGDGAAQVTLRFSSPATGVDVTVWGVDGLEVTSAAAPIVGATYAGGEAVTFPVAFRPGPGRSLLAVSVSGGFGGSKRTRVTTFAVGTPSAAQQKAKAEVQPDSAGERVRIMP